MESTGGHAVRSPPTAKSKGVTSPHKTKRIFVYCSIVYSKDVVYYILGKNRRAQNIIFIQRILFETEIHSPCRLRSVRIAFA
jgi:hypothetical protein